jgi:hypothetical protein
MSARLKSPSERIPNLDKFSSIFANAINGLDSDTNYNKPKSNMFTMRVIFAK